MPTENKRLAARDNSERIAVMSNNRAIGYARISKSTEGGCSLQMQEDRIRNYCSRRGLDIAEVVWDRVTGSSSFDSRCGGQKIRSAIERGVRNIVAFKLDRLFRDVEDALGQVAEWEQGGVRIHLLDVGEVTAGPVGRHLISMMAAGVELERNLIRERTACALQHKKRNGDVYSHTPYGYDRYGYRLKRNETEQQVIAMIKDRREAGWSFRVIAAELNSAGIPTKRAGKLWYASTVQQILANDLHEGVIVVGELGQKIPA